MRRRPGKEVRRRSWDEIDYWALDLEMSGLDLQRDSIISVGMVPIHRRAVRVGEGYSSLVSARGPMTMTGISAHQLLPSQLAGAPDLGEVVGEIDRRLQGAVLVVHAEGVDLPFLRRAFADCGRQWPAPPVVDTVVLLRRDERHHDAGFGMSSSWPADLAAARSRLGLPAHDAHDAFADAVATAELFLVLAHRLGARTLGDLL